MPYTIADWIHEYGEIRARLPMPDGGTFEVWLPIGVITGDTSPAPEWYYGRTHVGQEAEDLQRGQEMES